MSSTRSKDRELIATTSSLVEFLRDIALARRRRVTDVMQYDNVLWLDDLPAEVVINTEAGPGETLFAVPRIRAEAPPEPPAVLTNWLDRSALGDSNVPSPVLKERGPAWVVEEQPDGGKGMRAKVLPLEDAPDVGRAFEAWLPLWNAWAARDRKAVPFRRWYAALAGAAHLVTQQEDQYELVLGTGLLAWRTAEGTDIRNHVFATRLLAIVDGEQDAVRVVVDPEGHTRVQDRELLDGEPGYDATRVESVHDQVRDGAITAPLVDSEALATTWAQRALDVETPFIVAHAPMPKVRASAEMRLAPAVVLRRRERASLIGYYDAMLRALRGLTAQAPLGLAQLVTAMEADERLAWLDEEGAASGELLGADPLFPLPANPEQMRIMERLRVNNGVVVQGPPGTGKTHTIANLVSALLAQGQRVLVTSQKAQALRVLRDKLPAEVAKLCVSVTDLERSGSAELEGSVKAMSNRYAGFDATAHDDEVARSSQRRAELMSKVDSLTDQVRLLREAETTVHGEVAPGYAGPLAEIARRLRAAAPTLGWMLSPVPESAAGTALTAGEAGDLLRLLQEATPDRAARVHQAQVDPTAYPSAADVRAMIAAERAALDAAARGSTVVSRQLDGCDATVLRGLRDRVDLARHLTAQLGLDGDVTKWSPSDWAVTAITDALAQRNGTLWNQIEAGRAQVEAAGRAVATLGFRQVVVGDAPGSAGARLDTVRPLRDHLAEGGKLRSGVFKSAEQRHAEPVLEVSTVDGVAVATAEQVGLVAAALEAQACVETLSRGWAMVGVTLAGPSTEPVQQSVARVVDAYRRLGLVRDLLAAIEGIRETLAAVRSYLPLNDLEGWQEFVDALDAVRLRVEAGDATEALTRAAERLRLDAGTPDAPPELHRAAAAVTARDGDAYTQALTELAEAGRERAEQLACDTLDERLRVAHPGLAGLMAETADRPEWAARLSGWDSCLGWGRANTFFLQQRQPGREQQLEAELADTVARLRQETAQLAALQAWGHCLRRMTASQAQALQAYEQHMRAVGKGTGRYASRFRGLAREAMRAGARRGAGVDHAVGRGAGDAGPGARLVRRRDRRRGQSGQPGGPVPALAGATGDRRRRRQAVRAVPGTPRGAGADLRQAVDVPAGAAGLPARRVHAEVEPVRPAADPVRRGHPAARALPLHAGDHRVLVAPVLRRRAAGAAAPVRRRTGCRRCASVRVQGAATEGARPGCATPVEAEAIVAQIELCVADPAYEGRTFGVVVLQGTGQVQLIHHMLLERVEPKEWERRRLRVGTPPDFQGDERDVVFVSLVIAEKRAAVTGTEWQRRFNVAASRAKDQMWLFHSVGPELLTVTDLRASLLSYVLNPPPALAASAARRRGGRRTAPGLQARCSTSGCSCGSASGASTSRPASR